MTRKIFLLTIILSWLPIQAHADVFLGWEKHYIGDQTSPIYLYVKDMDGDGDLDVASTTNLHPGIYKSEVAWFQNNMNQELSWQKFIISSSDPLTDPITNANGIVVADIDGDGHEDVAVATGRVTEVVGSVYWFKAPETPTGVWERFDIELDALNSYFKIYTMDANEDSAEDIIVGGNQGAVLFLNPGNPTQPGVEWEKTFLPEESAQTGSSVYLDDINQDGTIDILNTYTGHDAPDLGSVSWFDVSYVSQEVVFEQTVIDPALYKAFDINCMDVNGDLNKDVIVTTFQNPYIYWYEAPLIGGDPWVQHLVSDTYEGTDLYTGDINENGDTDFVVSGLFDKKISWFEYNQSSWTENLIDNNVNLPGDISLDDLDGDGDLDVVLAAMGEHKMIWYENRLDDWDADGVLNEADNCSVTPNGPNQGTCTSGTIGELCMSDGDCGSSGFCSKNQEDTYPPGGNGIGDACECEGDLDCDGDVDEIDSTKFLEDFGRSIYYYPCDEAGTGSGTGDEDGDGIPNNQDNCWTMPNGPSGGFCAKQLAQGLFEIELSQSCTWHNQCDTGYFCELYQIDSNGNGIGDVCECESDFACDGDVDGTDVSKFLEDSGRANCPIRDCSQHCIY